MWLRRSGASCAALAVLFLAACTGGTRSASVPAGAAKADSANRTVTARGRHFATTLSAVSSVPIETAVDRAAAKGMRVFRIEQVAVVDPVSHQSFDVPRSEVRQTADGIVLFEGAKRIALSPQAHIASPKHYGYIFRRGSQSDPDPRLHAERIR
jgi:hypothetical protein